MSLDDDNHASSHHEKTRKKSMDMEFHDHVDKANTDTEPLTENLDGSNSHHAPVPNDDDDSFGEATEDSQPNQAFLDQILEDYHPERLNLLDSSIPEPLGASPAIPKKKDAPVPVPAKSAATTEEDDVEKTEPAAPKKEKESTPTSVDKPIQMGKKTEPKDEAVEDKDAFNTAPARPRPPTKSMLQNMGSSTKKSFRTIGGTFFSKSFRGLARSKRRPSTPKDFQ